MNGTVPIAVAPLGFTGVEHVETVDEVAAWLASHDVAASTPIGITTNADPAVGSHPQRVNDRGSDRGVAVTAGTPPTTGFGLAVANVAGGIDTLGVTTDSVAEHLRAIEHRVGPRWVLLDRTTTHAIAALGIALSRTWDVLTVHQLLRGGYWDDVAVMWCDRRDLDPNGAPTMGQMGLLDIASAAELLAEHSGRHTHGEHHFSPAEAPTAATDGTTDATGAQTTDRNGTETAGGNPAQVATGTAAESGRAFDVADDPESPVRPDGYLRPEWTSGGYRRSPSRMAEWSRLGLQIATEQAGEIATLADGSRVLMSANAESAAELLSAELGARGLPFRNDIASDIVRDAVGPRPTDADHDNALRAARDTAVIDLAPPGRPIDLRNPADVKEMLRRIGLDLPDTRAWRLKEHADHHPLVPALLRWRKAERLSNTYGYRWMDEHVDGGRLRGVWTSADGAAGRMTASAGLHNLPAELRPAVVADADFVFIRADLGQVEPRVLAAVSGDPALIAATAEDDLYQPVADRLRVERSVAKVAVLGAMYGATTGESANALRGLEREYPVAMKLLNDAAAAGQRGESVRTVGGRLVHMWETDTDGDLDRARRVAAARGRFARNALIQGAAAELFKMWAITVRARGRSLDAEVVMCLHDELLVHVPATRAADASTMVLDALGEAAYRWSPSRETRFVADISTIERWSDAK